MTLFTALALSAMLMIMALCLPVNAAVTDAKPGSWAYNAVQFNVNNKLIAVDLNKYQINKPARARMAYALYKVINGKDNEPSAAVTGTVAKEMTSSKAAYNYSVGWCMDHKIITGSATASLGPPTSLPRSKWPRCCTARLSARA